MAGAFEVITGDAFDEDIAHGGWRATIYPDDIKKDDRDLERLRADRPVISEIRAITKAVINRG